MKRTTIFLDEALEYDIKALARRRGKPVAFLVREALAEYVVGAKEAGAGTLSFVAAGASGRSDIAERHEELLWQEARPREEPQGPPPARAQRKRAPARKAGGKKGPR